MTQYHPEYDVKTNSWFIRDTEYEAPSIPELLIQLGPDAEIKDYRSGCTAPSIQFPVDAPVRVFSFRPLSPAKLYKPLPITLTEPILPEMTTSIPQPKLPRNRIWLITEVNELKLMVAEGKLSYKQMGNKFNRSKDSVFAQVKRLGLLKKDKVTTNG